MIRTTILRPENRYTVPAVPGLVLLVLWFFLISAESAPARQSLQDMDFRKSLAVEVEQMLTVNLLESWYPRVIDHEYGGYISRFDNRWKPEGNQTKMVVTQARHVWTASTASRFFDGDTTLLSYARHGYRFLRDVMRDKDYGGFYTMTSREGQPITGPGGSLMKEAYGNAFVIYGLAAYYRSSGDDEALQMAKEAFYWLDRHAYDPANGGYFQYMQRDGQVVKTGPRNTPPKDQNSTIHILEAFAELYRVWPDRLLRSRLEELVMIIRDTIRVDPGYLNLFFTAEWQPVSYRDSTAGVREARFFFDHVSFGHDVETAWLLLDAEDALGRGYSTETLTAARQMVDHALMNGWDHDRGGFFDAGYYLKGDTTLTIIRDTKNWWAQAEGLNTLLVMENIYPGDPMAYGERFLEMWAYINRYLIDHEHGGWYEGGLDKQPEFIRGPKAHVWKGNYHNGRALMNVIRNLTNN
jgi:cellobiose epimerase